MANNRDDGRIGTSRRHFMQLAGAAGAAATLPNFANLAHAQGAKTLRVRMGSDISVLDPSHVFQIENQTVCAHVFNGMVKYDQATNKIVADAASEWSVSGDAARPTPSSFARASTSTRTTGR